MFLVSTFCLWKLRKPEFLNCRIRCCLSISYDCDIDFAAALPATSVAISRLASHPAASTLAEMFFVTDTYGNQKEDGNEKGDTTSYLEYLDSLGLFTWHPDIPHTACDVCLLSV